ncbi:hypothetical protein KUTeg_018102 [Tegillarca granosa]|uniref:DNA 3'-5' helicase n=1 Tax=Tegillarca granosa TaxID=220873 RepID=A0ABQ9EGU7_TEGGR|nr:hypothetical protein KUTeg_018102 [Tegillarca granosa]
MGLDAFANEKSVGNRLIEMFHANTDESSKTRLLETFISVNSKIRVLISTVAFGMDVNVPDVEIIVHWGLPPTALSYWQETGRCGRDGRPSYAICYAYKRSVTKCEDDLLKETSENNECTRYCILKSLKKNVLEEILKKKECDKKCAELCRCDFCMCCSKCILKCKCLRKVENVRVFYSK